MTETQTTDRESYAVLVPSHDNRAWQLNFRQGNVIHQRKVAPYGGTDPAVLRHEAIVTDFAAGRIIIVPALGEKVPS